MILYFDSFIVDAPLMRPGFYDGLHAVRSSPTNYRDQSKVRISNYTLASYAQVKWDGVLIKYECAIPGQGREFEEFARDLFPGAIILNRRSSSQQHFRESLEILDSMPSDWVFVSSNNDHPIVAPSLDALDACMAEAETQAAKNEFVSVPYSHLVELRCMANPEYTIAWYNHRNFSRRAENDTYLVVHGRQAFAPGIQIMHKRMLRRLVTGKDYGESLVRRTDDMDMALVRDHIMVVSKQPIADHYDGYAHRKMMFHFLPYETYPPLFIPPGFFERDIRVAYGFDRTRSGWVNVNPSAGLYSFQDAATGTDMKSNLDDLPAFWRPRIKEIEVNPDVDRKQLERQAVAVRTRMNHPWPKVPAIVSRSVVTYYRVRSALLGTVAERIPFARQLVRMLRRIGLLPTT